MHNKGRFPNVMFGARLRPDSAALAIMVLLLFLIFVFLFLMLTAQSAQAQTYNVIHNFTGGRDGGNPNAGLSMDGAGNLYGTTLNGGSGYGTVFKLSDSGSGWAFTQLYSFSGNDGAGPAGGLTIGPDGAFYGTTYWGGGSGSGTVFRLQRPTSAPASVLGGWIQTVLYSFAGGNDGANPYLGDLIFDRAGNIYGTTQWGGAYGEGTIYELTPLQGGWTETVLYSFSGGEDGGMPVGGVILDQTGNLYGTAVFGGIGACEYGGCGNVFQLTPSGSGWTDNVIHYFQGGDDGAQPVGGLVSDRQGYLYGTSAGHGARGGGTAFETWQGQGWEFLVLYSFTGDEFGGPYASLVVDATGNLYGTTYQDGASSQGSVFKLTKGCAGFGYTSLHDFSGGQDGANPVSSLVFDANGNIFGTTSAGGAYGNGTVFEITPAEGSKAAPEECGKDQ